MSESLRMWVEISFDIAYLVVVWGLVAAMVVRQNAVTVADRAVARGLKWAFALLALGDTGHVGFRVIAYALGSLESRPVVFGVPVSLVGVGAFSTAVTVTLFYMLLVDVWRRRFNRRLEAFAWLLLAAGIVRLLVMLFPQNQWDQVVPPYNWSLARNAFLVVQGLGVMALIFRDATQAQDRPFIWIGVMLALSYAFYAPVILWSAQVPLLGMLMIPKTCAYVGVAIIAYSQLYARRGAPRPAPQATAVEP